MAIRREHRGVPRPLAGGMEGFVAGGNTSSAVDPPSGRCNGATPLPRSAHCLAACSLVALALAGCDPYVQGNGVYLEERRPGLAPFVGLHVEDGIEATVTAGTPAQDVLVSGDANVVAYIRTQVEMDGGRSVLHVFVSEQFGKTIPPRVVIDVPTFEYVLATQGSRAHVRNAATPAFRVIADQGSALDLAGANGSVAAGESISVELASGAVLDAASYPVSQSASVALSGASLARLRSDGPVTGTVANASELDNLLGSGDCSGVVADQASRVRCRPPAVP